MIKIIESKETKLTSTNIRGFCLGKHLLNLYSNEGFLRVLDLAEIESVHTIAVALWVLSTEVCTLDEIEMGLNEIVKDKIFIKSIEKEFSDCIQNETN